MCILSDNSAWTPLKTMEIFAAMLIEYYSREFLSWECIVLTAEEVKLPALIRV